MTEIYYKIRRSDGLYSTGGMDPDFQKKGKVWREKHHLSNHLNQCRNVDYIYRNCKVIEFEVIERAPEGPSLQERIAAMHARERGRQEERERWREEFKRKEAERNLEGIKKEFPELL
jgi:hypothetical protein